MCIIISDRYTVTKNIAVHKLCRIVNSKELRSEWKPDLRTIAARKEIYPRFGDSTVAPGEGGTDILYRHYDDVGKRILITNEHPGFCVFKDFDLTDKWKSQFYEETEEYRLLKGIIPAGASIFDIARISEEHKHLGYATNMLEINCDDPWPVK